RREGAKDEGVVIRLRDADPAQQQHVRSVGLDGQPHLGLHLEVRWGAALDQVDERKVPKIEGELHGRETIRSSGGGPEQSYRVNRAAVSAKRASLSTRYPGLASDLSS